MFYFKPDDLPVRTNAASGTKDLEARQGGNMKNELTVGEMAKRSGVAVSTLHFYEKTGLIKAGRNAGNQRRYPRGHLRLVAIIRIAQRAGKSLSEIKETLSSLPDDRAPNC